MMMNPNNDFSLLIMFIKTTGKTYLHGFVRRLYIELWKPAFKLRGCPGTFWFLSRCLSEGVTGT
jgi:hypothetical protein